MRVVHIVIVVLLAGLAGCAGPQASGMFQSKASYDKLYVASLDAATSLGYTVTSSNKADGLIVAQYGVVGPVTALLHFGPIWRFRQRLQC